MHAQDKNGSIAGVNHPSPEDCVASLYGELPQPEQAQVTQHLRDCQECRAQVNGWRDAMNLMDEYRVPVVRAARPAAAPFFKWGIAAAFALGLGFALGHFAAPATPDTSALRASVKAEILAELQQQQRADNKLIADAIVQSEVRSSAKLLALRHDLETVAVRTQDGLQHAQEQIVTLATYSPGQVRQQHP